MRVYRFMLDGMTGRRVYGFTGLRVWAVTARARTSGKVEFLEISEALPFGVDIAEPIFRNSVIFVKQRGRYGYGGRPGRSSDSEVWAQNLTCGLRS